MVVSSGEFKRISMCDITNEAWDILEVTHNGIKMVKTFKLQMLTSRFKEIRNARRKIFKKKNYKLQI
jgi:hypothetical protein